MPVTAVVGANWGDEGKGKLCDSLAETSDIVIRFQGGKNAGHTIINQYGKFALHLVPCGVCHAHTTNLLGPGVAVDVTALLSELSELRARGAPNPHVLIADRAQVVLPWHVELDRLEEARRGAAKFGSTQSGIAPFYADKYLKVGIQAGELFDAGHLRARLEHTLPRINVLREHLYGAAPLCLDRVVEELLALGAEVRGMVVDSTALLQAALRDGKHLLLEGQLGALRDPDHGIYPYVTSSSPLAGFATVGAGVPAHAIDRVVATVKAYSSCVGAGPFTTELTGPCGDELRERGGDAGEYGATTGRPRRVGWFDAVATRYGCAVQGRHRAGRDPAGRARLPGCHSGVHRLRGGRPACGRLPGHRDAGTRPPGVRNPARLALRHQRRPQLRGAAGRGAVLRARHRDRRRHTGALGLHRPAPRAAHPHHLTAATRAAMAS